MVDVQIRWRCKYRCWWNPFISTAIRHRLPSGWKRPIASCVKLTHLSLFRPSTIVPSRLHCPTYSITFQGQVFPTNPVASSATLWVSYLIDHWLYSDFATRCKWTFIVQAHFFMELFLCELILFLLGGKGKGNVDGHICETSLRHSGIPRIVKW